MVFGKKKECVGFLFRPSGISVRPSQRIRAGFHQVTLTLCRILCLAVPAVVKWDFERAHFSVPQKYSLQLLASIAAPLL